MPIYHYLIPAAYGQLSCSVAAFGERPRLPDMQSGDEPSTSTSSYYDNQPGNGSAIAAKSLVILGMSQELFSVLVLVVVVVSVATITTAIWMLKCRRINNERNEQRASEQRRRDHYNQANDKKGTPFSNKKVADKPILVKKGDTDDATTASATDSMKSTHGQESGAETMEQFENRVKALHPGPVHSQLERIREETPKRNKRMESLSNVDSSVETLQRNDSKVNVFNTDKNDEVDYNPALSNSINLDTI